jgi:hypothetical protein
MMRSLRSANGRVASAVFLNVVGLGDRVVDLLHGSACRCTSRPVPPAASQVSVAAGLHVLQRRRQVAARLSSLRGG